MTSKACWPSHLERQNVKLALKVFNGSTAAGLSSFNHEYKTGGVNQTVEFLNLINTIWDIFNVNWVGKDIRFNNPNLAPLRSSDQRLSFLEKVVKWLDTWRAIPTSNGKLSLQTFTSFKHTCIALPLLVRRLTVECGFEYLLTSRIQNDPLEHHFGLYRQMSGSNYSMSYSQVLESERRLKLSNILKFFYIKQQTDTVSLKDLRTFSEDNGNNDMQLKIDFEYFTNEIAKTHSPIFDQSQIECLNYIAGYAVFSYLKRFQHCMKFF